MPSCWGGRDPRSLLLALIVSVWALRLGIFLFRRIRREGVDRRFDALKPDRARFILTWTLQGLWVFLAVSCALAALTGTSAAPLGLVAALGTVLWAAARRTVKPRWSQRCPARRPHR